MEQVLHQTQAFLWFFDSLSQELNSTVPGPTQRKENDLNLPVLTSRDSTWESFLNMLWFSSMIGVVCMYKSSCGTLCHRFAALWNTGRIVNQVARAYRTGKAVSHSSEHTQRRPFIIWEWGYAAALYACFEQTLIYKHPLNQGRWIDWCQRNIACCKTVSTGFKHRDQAEFTLWLWL